MARSKIYSIVAFVLLAVLAVSWLAAHRSKQRMNQTLTGPGIQAGDLKLTSPDFTDGSDIPSTFTCDGQNVNPTLQIAGVPANAKSLALIVDDPDSPSGDFLHWIIWNIDPKTNEISRGAVPPGSVQGKNDFGNSIYGGPCPGSGKHRYVFRLYALSVQLQLGVSASRADVESAVSQNVIAEAQLVGLYQRK